MRFALLLLLSIVSQAYAGIVSFGSNFPDQKLRGQTYDVQSRDHADALRLRSAIYAKEAEIVAHVRSCSPNSKNWRAEAERFNQLRAENWAMIKELRAIVARAY